MDYDEDLFREIILDHHKRPRNLGKLENPTKVIDGTNPETGDNISIEIILNEDTITNIKYQAKGSAVLIASCSLMTIFAKSKTTKQVIEGIQLFQNMLQGETNLNDGDFSTLGDGIALSGIRQFPARVRCASLPWRTLEKALSDNSTKV